MFEWNEKSLQWIQQAATYSDYYQNIAQPITNLLDKNSRVCEIACGCGHLSLTLAQHAQHVTAIDINSMAVSVLQQEIVSKSIKNISPVVEDWLTYTAGKQFDIVLFSHFSAIEDHLEDLIQIAKKFIIAIVPEKNNHTISPQLYKKKKRDYSKKVIMESTADILKRLRIPFTQVFQENEFGQPLIDRNDAYEYIKHYYNIIDSDSIEQFLEGNLIRSSTGYYLPKMKRTRTIIIDVNHIPPTSPYN